MSNARNLKQKVSTRRSVGRMASVLAILLVTAWWVLGADSIPASSMSTTRFYHTATPLADGRVLVAGGYDGSQFLASAEVYDPTTNLWSPGGILGSPRSEHTATPLAGGRVLVAGGYGGTVLAKAEVYDPATNSWSPAGTMGSPRLQHTATALADGRVLVVGGNGSIGSGTSAEVYDPSTNSWSPVSGMACSHTYHAATRLTDGRVLVAGGSSESPYAEVYDPATNLWSPTGTMGSPRYFRPTASALTDGRVLVAGGYDGGSLASAEVYDPATNLWSPAGTMGSPRFSHTATSFGDDRVLIVGGYGGSGPVASAEIYDPAANLWTTFGTMSSARYGHTATALANGRILVAGGQSGGADLASVEIFQLQVDHPPVAVVIAPTRTVEAAPGGGIVTLDARGSSDPDGDSLSYNWTSPGFTLPSGPFIEYPFPVGTWSITLTVTDPFGLSSSQVFTVTVVDTLPPSISNVPNSIIVDQTSALGAVVTFPWPTAEDNYDPLVIVHGSSDPAGVVPNTSTSSTPFLFPVGTTTVFFSAADQSGNPSDVAQMTVTVRPNAATPSQIYVNSAATGENFGSSWTDAFTNLQSALAVAPAGSEIWVAAGTYVPGTQRSDSFHLKPQVNLYGGFAGTEATREQRDWLSNITTLDGQVGPSVSSYHVVIGADNAALDGFTVVNGLADGAGTDGQGGGMLNLGVSPTVLNCVFTSNSARAGGAIYNDSNSSLISRCTFRGNIGSGSAALDEGGGAMYNRSTSLTLRNCTFINNQTGVSSGGALFNVSGAPTLTNCVFQGNRATSHGGAIANVWLTTATNNCTFVGNRCGGDGGAVADTNCPGMTYLNCIFWKNVAGAPSNQLSLFGADCTISFCDIQGGLFGPGVRLTGGEALTDGGGNLDANPQFADPSGASQDGLRLWLGSPCIDRGSPIGAPSDDLLGRSRPQGMGVDIGAYEWVPSGPGRRLYVKADATGANTGLSWADAFTNLQPALIAASAGDEIWVARGFYVPGTSRSDSFQLKSWVNVYGGFSGTETVREQRDWLNNVTTLTGRINSSLSSYHVVKGADDALLDAFLVRDGNADGPGDDGFGGGVLNLGVSPTLRHCWIMVNTARGGAGVYNRDNSPSFSYCWFYFNFAHGTSYWEEGGGGLANSNARVTLKGCLFGDCRALDNFTSGGGIWQMQGSLDATNCAFFRNTSSYVGGGLASYSSSVSLMNCTFTRNQSGSAGGALLNWPSSATITNSIFWDDLAGGASEILLQGTPATVAFCDVQGGIGGPGVQVTDGAMVNDGGGTFSQDPYFADVTGSLFGSAVVSMSLQDGLRLKAGSPCINAGTAVGAPPDDLLGVQRPQGTGIDIGAYENPMEALTVLIHYPTTEPSYTTASTRMTLGGDAFSWPYSTGTLTYSLSGATSGSGTIPFSRNWVSSPITFNPGTTEVTVNLVGPTGTSIDHVTINVVSAPAITSPLSISGIRGQAFNYQILATGFPLPAIQVGPLPPGLSFDPGTGMIVGTPDTWGSYDVPLSASNSYGTDSKILRIDIANLPPTADIVGPTFIQAGSTVTFLGSGSIDPFHDPLTYSWDLSGIPLGTTPDITFIVLPPNVLGFQPLTLTVTNPAGLASTRTLLVDIEDTEPPALTAPALIRVEQTERNGAWVDLQCQAIDAFEGPVDVIVESTEPPGAIPPGTVVRGPFLIQLGTWIVHVMAGDSTGHQTRAQITVTVEDTTPPVLTVAPEERTFNDSNSFYSVVQVRRTVDFGSGDDGAPLAPGGGDQFYGATGLSVGGIRFTDSWGYLYARGSGDPLLYGSLSYSSSSFSTLRASLPRGVTAFGTLIRPFNAAPSAVVRITLSNGQVFQESGFLFNQWRFFGASSVTPIQWIDFELMADPIAGYDFNTLLFDNFSVGLGPNTWEAGDPPRLAPVQASDLCDANPMVNTDLSVITGVGTFTLVYTATDASHNTSLPVPVRVTVVDTTPPVFGANPGPFTIPQTSLNGTPFNVPLPAITDAGDPSPKVVSDAPAKFPLGTTSVTITATDASGNSSSMIITVTVVAALPPQLVFTFDPATDTDGDGIPDIIDPDIDGDGIPNSIDNAPFVWNPDQSDLDGDGVGDVIDPDPAFAGIHTVVHLFTIRVERNRSEGADHVTLPPVSAFEGLGGNPTLTNNAPLIFPLGPTLVRYTAVGSAGLTAYGIGIVIVVDTIPPDTTLSGPPPATSSTSATFTFSSSESNCTFQRKLDGGAWVPAVSPETISGLANGSHVYRVRAIDSAGNVDPTPASLSWIVDTSAPQKGSAVVNDGPGADLDAQTSTTIQANWSGFADPQSGIALYEWAIGTKSGGADIQPFLSVGTNTSAINNSLTVAPGIRYFVTVRATNGAGIQTTKSSDGVWVVTGPPPAGTVRDGAGADIDVQASNTMIQANWTAFTDAQSGPVTYEWAIGTVAGGEDVQPFTSTGTTRNGTNSILSLVSGVRYYVTVRATNLVAMRTLASSDGVVVDTSPPALGTVNDGGTAGVDIDTQTSKTTIKANWTLSDPESGIKKLEWAIGTSPGASDIMAFKSIGTSTTSASKAGLTLVSGSWYYVTIRATNGVGDVVTGSSNGVKVQ